MSVRLDGARLWHLWISLAAIALFGFLFSENTLARLAWEQYRAPKIARALDRRDAALAMAIGGYYFNGGAYDPPVAEWIYQRAVRPPLTASGVCSYDSGKCLYDQAFQN